MATPLVQYSKPGTSRSVKGRAMFPAFIGNEVAMEELFPDVHEEELRINGGYRSKCGAWFVRNDGGVEIDAYQHRFLGYLMPVEVIDMMLSDEDEDIIEQYPPELLLEWHEEDHQSNSDPACVFCQDRHRLEHFGKYYIWCDFCQEEHDFHHDKPVISCPFCFASSQSEKDCPECYKLGHYCSSCRGETEAECKYCRQLGHQCPGCREDDKLNQLSRILLSFVTVAEEKILAQTTDKTSTLKTEPLRKPRSAYHSRRRR